MEPPDRTDARSASHPSLPGAASAATPPSGFFQTQRSPLQKAVRRLTGRSARREPLLPLLIKVYAGFSKLDGEAEEEEIESSLGFLRYDYPSAVYSELRELYRNALRETQDLNSMAAQLATRLTHDEKILLAVQLYVLITRSRTPAAELFAFQSFMANLGVGAEARGIVGQLNEAADFETGSPATLGYLLESLDIGGTPPAHLVLEQAGPDFFMTVFRFQNLLLLKNTGPKPVIARGRQLRHGEFMRLYEGQRVVLGDAVLDYQDLVFYLNARKGVSSTQLYLNIGSSGSPYIERERSKLSVLRIQFGLNVRVTALQASEVRVAGQILSKNGRLTVGINDRITFPDSTEITFAELRRRARELGGRFDLNPSRTEYLVSNNPALLQEGDIVLSPSLRSEILLRIRCDYENKSGELEVLKAARPVEIGRQPVREKERAHLDDGAVISLGEGQYLRCRFGDRIIEEERNIVRSLEVRDLTHHFSRNVPAVESISFTVRRGEMVCVMGPSGCGKSTLLRMLAGHLKPNHGTIFINGMSLYHNLDALTPLISYIPHEDAYDPLLTVEENLREAATMRTPHLQPSDIRRRVDGKLLELGLHERRDKLAGTPEQKNLSGGQRKRLNIGMDMITPADIFLFDEPTSGLSSKDSEHILEIIRGLANNKIVLVSIHQPSARLFHLFHKTLLLDNGGKPVYFGKPQDALDYFREAWEEELARPARESGAPLPQPDFNQPEFIFDVLETPLRDLSGDILYEEDSRGHMRAARRFSPDFWRDRFQTHLILGDTRDPELNRDDTAGASRMAPLPTAIRKPGARDRGTRFGVMVRRAFLSRLRNRGNLLTTLLEAPMLAVLIATVLRYSEDGNYNFASAFHVPTYLFLSLVVAMFLGLTNSAGEIIRDRILLQRERNYCRNAAGYICSKLLSLGSVCLIQNLIYLVIGNSILEIREMFLPYLAWMFATSMCGVAIGLFISSLVPDVKVALNIIPLVLIPQIILGGALIKYEEMNRNLDFVYSIRRWLDHSATGGRNPSNLRVPFICEFMPLRWTYESLVLSQANLNPLAAAQEKLNALIQELPSLKSLSEEQKARFDQAKEALVKVSGLEERTPDALVRRIKRIMAEVEKGTYDPEAHRIREKDQIVSAEQIFENQKIRDLVSKAEMERLNFRMEDDPPNVMFGKEKRISLPWLDRAVTTDTLSLNAAISVVWILLPLGCLYVVLRRQLRRV